MADIPSTKLEKALARRGFSSTDRPAWQEWMERHDSVPAKAILAPEVLQGFSGSWAAQYSLDNAVQSTTAPITPAQVQRRSNHLGQPGVGEIDFRPYDWGTTRQGKYGPSLLGHPVSFEVVGPTAKSPQLLHQWVLTQGVSQDTLTLDTITWNSTTAVPEGLPAAQNQIVEIYGISAIPEEGLYMVVSLAGGRGDLADIGSGVSGTGGLGDGIVGQQIDGSNPRAGLKANGQKSKYEIFRVSSLGATSITLAAGKRIGDYFTIPSSTAIIRAITLLKPAAARMVAVPGSGETGKEQVFAFVPPEKALTPDILPISANWGLGTCDPWLDYVATASPGSVDDYDQKVALPIPMPIRQGTGRLRGINGEGILYTGMGRLPLVLDSTTTYATSDVGKIIRIFSVSRYQDGNWSTATLDGGSRIGDPELDRLLGYWEIEQLNLTPNYYTIRMAAQFDPATGVPFYGASEFTNMAQAGIAPGVEVRIQWTLHDPVSSLWTDRHLATHKLDSARLQDIIDPMWVRTTAKNIDLTHAEASPSRPDRAAFNTTSGEDPGSLMDLGFRPVFYPAKASVADPAKLVPDFANPIYSNELVLDPTITTESQFIQVDYGAGLVLLSHAPKAGAGCQLCPASTILSNASNPRQEMVFFSSFVPFSREPGQRGTAPRVTGGQVLDLTGEACGDTVEFADVYGARLYWPLAAAQTITMGTTSEIKLGVALTAIDLPPTGFIEVVAGDTVSVGAPALVDGRARRVSTFGYTSVLYNDVGNGGNTTLRGCYGGGINGANLNITVNAPYTAVLRRDVISPNRTDGTTGTDFQSDTTYGLSKRGAGLRFKRATTVVESDGSVTVDTRDPLTVDQQNLFSDLFSSWAISGGEMTASLPLVGSTLEFSELTVVIQGVRSVVPAQQYVAGVVGLSGTRYIYIDGSSPECPVYATGTALPLPDGTHPPVTTHHILIGQYTWSGANIVGWFDLRQPMVDIDKRLDVTVGQPRGHDLSDGGVHFATLAEAVTFVSKTMRPDSGLHGKYRRIKVVGPTTEDVANLPIKPMVPGLIIEGASRCMDGTEVDPQEITWTGATAPALFDLSGCDGLIIRDVNFRFITSAASATPRQRCLFTADETVGGQVVKDVLIENVTLYGPAHGFLYVNDDVDVNTGFDGITLRNCKATELTDFAVWCDQTVDPADNLLIDRCHFVVRKSTDVPGPELALGNNTGVLVHTGPGVPYRWIVQNSHLEGGRFSAHLYGTDHTFRSVRALSSDKCAMVIGDGTRILFDQVEVTNCYTVPGVVLALPDRVALYVDTSGPTRMTSCHVELNTHAAGDYAIYSTAKLDLFNSVFQAKVQTGPESRVTNCHIFEELYLDNNSVGAGNLVEAVLGAGNLEAGNTVLVTDTVVQGVFNSALTALSARIINTQIQGVTPSFFSNLTKCTNTVVAGQGTVTDGCMFTTCTFTRGITNSVAVSSSANTFTGCLFGYSASSAMLVDTSVFQGNVFYTLGLDLTLDFDGVENTFSNNHVAGNVTVLLRDTALTDRTGLIVKGNLFYRLGVSAECGLAVYGNYCTVEGNLVEGVETTLGSSGILVAGPGGPPTAGAHNNIVGNIVGRAGTSIGIGCNITESVVSGNRCFGALQTGSTTLNTTITGNTVGEDGISVGVMLNILGGGASRLSVTGNVVSSQMVAGALNSTYNDNVVTGNLIASGAGSSYTGNRLEGDATFSANNCVVGSNQIQVDCTLSGDEITFSGNEVLGALLVSGADCTLSGSFAHDEYTFSGDGLTCTGCRLGFPGKVGTVTGENMNLKGNTFLAMTTFGGVANTKVQNLVGNHFVSAVNFSSFGLRESVVDGNKFDAVVVFNGTIAGSIYDTAVTNNIFGNTFTCNDGRANVFSGNRFYNTVTLNTQNHSVIQGNMVGTTANPPAAINMDLSGSDNYVCVGNLVSGTLTVDDAGDAGGNSGVVVGNRAAVLATNNAPNAGTVVVGNKTTNAGGNTNFNTAPGVGPTIANNVEV